MTEVNVKKLIEEIKEKAYVPGDRFGVSEEKVILLRDVISLIEKHCE